MPVAAKRDRADPAARPRVQPASRRRPARPPARAPAPTRNSGRRIPACAARTSSSTTPTRVTATPATASALPIQPSDGAAAVVRAAAGDAGTAAGTAGSAATGAGATGAQARGAFERRSVRSSRRSDDDPGQVARNRGEVRGESGDHGLIRFGHGAIVAPQACPSGDE